MNWLESMGTSAGVSSGSNRITLVRDNGEGKPPTRTVFIDHLYSPFGVALVGADLYVANTNAILRFPYKDGETSITAPGTVLTPLPGGPIDHHWTKSLVASEDGDKLYAGVGSNSNITENGIGAEANRAAIWEIDRATGAQPAVCHRAAQPERAELGTGNAQALDGGQRARRVGAESGARLPDVGEGWGILRLAVQLLRPARGPAGDVAAA